MKIKFEDIIFEWDIIISIDDCLQALINETRELSIKEYISLKLKDYDDIVRLDVEVI